MPPIHPELKTVTLSREERALYRMLEDRFRGMINSHFKDGTAEKNYGVYLAQLLRLRQAASHPFLLEKCIKDLFNSEDLIALKKRLRFHKKDKRPIYEQIEQWVSRSATSEPNQSSSKVPFGRSDFGKSFDFEKFLTDVDLQKLYARIVCIVCMGLPEDCVKTDCGHIFCRTCLEGHLHAQAANSELDYTTCPKCEKIFARYEPWSHGSKSGDSDAGYEEDGSISSQTTRQNSRKKDAIFKPGFKNSEWLKMCIKGDQNLLPSAKMIALKAQILRWTYEAPDDKILSKNIYNCCEFPR